VGGGSEGEVSQRCRKGSANHQQWRKEAEKSKKGDFGLVLPKVDADGMQEKGQIKQRSLQMQMRFIKTFIVRDAANGNSTKRSRSGRDVIVSLYPAGAMGPCPVKLTGDNEMVPSHPVVS